MHFAIPLLIDSVESKLSKWGIEKRIVWKLMIDLEMSASSALSLFRPQRRRGLRQQHGAQTGLHRPDMPAPVLAVGESSSCSLPEIRNRVHIAFLIPGKGNVHRTEDVRKSSDLRGPECSSRYKVSDGVSYGSLVSTPASAQS
jgi:hypothetical protein